MTQNYDHCPYFYVIRHKKTGIKYIGAKWGPKLTHPDLLLKPGGYTTSSDLINSMIDNEGMSSFEIEEIVIESELPDEFESVAEYEIYRIAESKAVISGEYFNGGNTRLKLSIHGSKKINLGYWFYRQNDHLIDFLDQGIDLPWMFQEDDLDLPESASDEIKKEQSDAVSIIRQFLKSRSLTPMRPVEVGLPPSYVDWRPEALYQVIHDLAHNFGSILRVQRKRRNF